MAANRKRGRPPTLGDKVEKIYPSLSPAEVAGAVWRKYERGDDYWYKALEPSIRKAPDGRVEGYGICKFPKGTWK